MSKRALIVILSLTATVVVGAVFFFFDPAQGGFYPGCMFHKLTGLSCPGCGSLRALHHLTHGDFIAAFGSNPLLIVLLPLLAFIGLRWLKLGREAFKGNPVYLRPVAAWTLLVGALAFTILRNLSWPAFAWMSP